MRIFVRGFVSMQQYTDQLPEGGVLEVSEGITLKELLTNLGIPPEEQKWTLTFINGRHKEPETIIQTDDSIVFFPPLEGG